MDNSTTLSFFEKVYKNEVSKTDQLLFIKNCTEFDLNRLKYLLHDLDQYINSLHFEISEVPDLEDLEPHIKRFRNKGKDLPVITTPNDEYVEALINDEDLSEISEYTTMLDVTKLMQLKEFYPLQIFRNHILTTFQSLAEKQKEKSVESPPLDLSNTKATEKIVYLKELGIIDHLRKQEPFKHSINKLATVLSAITDERATTLQPTLNSMLSDTNTPEKNPYNSKRTAPKVKAMLTELGYLNDKDG